MTNGYDRNEEVRRRDEEGRVANPRIDSEGRTRKDVRVDNGGYRRETDRVGRGAYSTAEAERGTSWVSVVLGWLAALGAGLIFSGIVGAIVGAILGTGGPAVSATESGIAGLVGLLITLLLAFLVGGYVAGRLASRYGLKHGLLVALVALVVTLVLAIMGAILGTSLIDNLAGVTLPGLPNDAPQNLGTIFTVSGILALLFPFIGGAIGGTWGARTGRRRP